MKSRFSFLHLLTACVILFFSCNKSGVVQPPITPPPPEKTYKVSVYAGKIGLPGFMDGPALSAQFKIMGGVDIDPQGILYEADPDNNRIRRVALDSSVSTYAGNGVMGYNDGPATTAQFLGPNDVAVDGQGNIIVCEAGSRIRKITPVGMVSTLTGAIGGGYMDGAVSIARFNEPASICIDVAGNIYVSDTRNYRIRKISTSGMVSTIAGNGNQGYVDGNALNAEFFYPFGIAVDAQGNVFVADPYNRVIRKISNGIVSTYAGSGVSGYEDGPAATAKFIFPWGLAIGPDGNLYVADAGDHRIRKITTNGIVSTFAGIGTAGYTNGNIDVAQLAEPRGIVIDNNGVFYIGDALGYCIRKISKY